MTGRPNSLSPYARRLIGKSAVATRELAKAYGVSQTTIWRLTKGRRKPFKQLTDLDRQTIRRSNRTNAFLAAFYGVSRKTIWRIRHD